MRKRLEDILALLVDGGDYLTAEFIADQLGVGVRTVFRDVNELSLVMARLGVPIERKRSKGIRLLGDPTEALAAIGRPNPRIEGLRGANRRHAIFLYLVANPRIVKLSEIGREFFISDSSVSNDLRELESDLDGSSVSVVRRKGTGVRVVGDERNIRLQFLGKCIALVDYRAFASYVTSGRGEEEEDGRRFLTLLFRTLGLYHTDRRVLTIAKECERVLGYRLAYADFSLLYLYLLLAQRRFMMGRSISESRSSGVGPGRPLSAADRAVEALMGSGAPATSLPGEIEFLASLLLSLEPGEAHAEPEIHPAAREVKDRILQYFEAADQFLYEFSPPLQAAFLASVSSLLRKKIAGIPRWHERGILQQTMFPRAPVVGQLIRETVEDSTGARLSDEDLQSLNLSLSAAYRGRGFRSRRWRVVISCFEGLSLAHYLSAVVRARFPQLEIVESVASTVLDESYLKERNVDFVISTFPLRGLSVLVHVVRLPLNEAEFSRDLADSLRELRDEGDRAMGRQLVSSGASRDGEDGDGIPIDLVLKLISDFVFIRSEEDPGVEKAIELVAGQLTQGKGHRTALIHDLQRRESFGAVVLEDIGVRLLHCRSSAVIASACGVIRSPQTYFFVIAPENAADGALAMLSALSVALVDDDVFAASVVSGASHDIRRSLLRLYGAA